MLFAVAASGPVPTGLECFLCGIFTTPPVSKWGSFEEVIVRQSGSSENLMNCFLALVRVAG